MKFLSIQQQKQSSWVIGGNDVYCQSTEGFSFSLKSLQITKSKWFAELNIVFEGARFGLLPIFVITSAASNEYLIYFCNCDHELVKCHLKPSSQASYSPSKVICVCLEINPKFTTYQPNTKLNHN